jgi:SAM-dependent methyltransferase
MTGRVAIGQTVRERQTAGFVGPTSRRLRRLWREARGTVGAAIRRAASRDEFQVGARGVLSSYLRRGLDEHLMPPPGSRRIEIGCGLRPQPGYIHVDTNRSARHVEFFARAWDLPFQDDWAEELLSIHVLEHVPPRLLKATLAEWYRVLQPGGVLRVHVPDSEALMKAYLVGPREQRWSVIGALLGMYANAGIREPDELTERPDHHVLFDRDLLCDALLGAGFVELEDRSQVEGDVHTDGWSSVVRQISLIVRARKPSSDAVH